MKRFKKILIGLLSLLVLLALAGLILIKTKTYTPSAEATAISQTATQNTADYLYFASQGGSQKPTIFFYAGGLVEAESYSPLAQALAEDGYPVYVIKSLLNLPVLNSDKGLKLIEEIQPDSYLLAGHSLGGVMASQNAAELVEDAHFKGLILLAAYPASSTEMSETDISVLSITASKDKVLNWTSYEEGKARLPQTTDYVSIKGGNHSQFGSYGHQAGDGQAAISSAMQLKEILTAIDQWSTTNKN
ncbi:alpha/beta hydrolase [Streptococcus caprae]|uniref:Alpha/beta hydrolase n=1 Tax=Streptococcus caprae TaxID=1640501 RepID=A0ABV8CY40_9STRE